MSNSQHSKLEWATIFYPEFQILQWNIDKLEYDMDVEGP